MWLLEKVCAYFEKVPFLPQKLKKNLLKYPFICVYIGMYASHFSFRRSIEFCRRSAKNLLQCLLWLLYIPIGLFSTMYYLLSCNHSVVTIEEFFVYLFLIHYVNLTINQARKINSRMTNLIEQIAMIKPIRQISEKENDM